MEQGFRVYRRNLPHWRAAEAAYLVTWNLAHGQNSLAPGEKDVVLNALLHFDKERYELIAFVVMDDHVHVLTHPREGWRLEQIVHSWKSFTAHALAAVGRKTPVWQAEYCDRVIRNEAEFLQKADYIRANPGRRWPDIEDYRWVSEW